MRKCQNNITIEKREWQTYYDPELVGEYLNWFYANNKLPFEPGELIEVSPGMILPTIPEPTLEGFLRWCAPTDNKLTKEKSEEG